MTGLMSGFTGRLAMGLAFGVLALGCAGRKSVIAEAPASKAEPETVAEATVAADSGAALASDPRALADLLWAGRGHPDTARAALSAYIEAAAKAPDAALLARLSRAYYLVANYVETREDARDSLFLEGVEAAERAMALHPGFLKVFKETQDEKKAVLELGLDHIEAIYWYSANLGKWAASKSLMVRLGNKGKLEAYNKRVLDLDEKYFHGAPHRFFGALPTKVPGGDMEASKRHFEKAIAIEPNYFGTRTLYAELYATKARDRETFVRQLDYVINTPASSLPDAEPENRYEQDLARKLKERANELFD
jgi:hypothetical protein